MFFTHPSCSTLHPSPLHLFPLLSCFLYAYRSSLSAGLLAGMGRVPRCMCVCVHLCVCVCRFPSDRNTKRQCVLLSQCPVPITAPFPPSVCVCVCVCVR